jgi:hypothetical protein
MSEAESVEADLLVPWLAARARAQRRVQHDKFLSFIIFSFAFFVSGPRSFY